MQKVPWLLWIVIGYIHAQKVSEYIQKLEKKNGIEYEKILNTYGAYIPPMCYTKTKNTQNDQVANPCYSCHRQGKIPNYFNNTYLQNSYDFPVTMRQNPYMNLFKDRSSKIKTISIQQINTYIKKSNYFDEKQEIILEKKLPKSWEGYRPDCYYNFDNEGFDHKPNGDYTLWRKFSYYPFLGTFFPTNGSMDDVLIRLDKVFSQNETGDFNIDIYKKNFQIVESLIKQEEPLPSSYIGLAQIKKFQLSSGLLPLYTEFLHSVRYIDWNKKNNIPTASTRMKELRYAQKIEWRTYAQLQKNAHKELLESQQNDEFTPQLSFFRGDYKKGFKNNLGWNFQAFIEDKEGELRPQTHEELLYCMGCHSHLSVTQDSSFSFARKFSWGEKSLKNILEPKVHYLKKGTVYEYSFYLKKNHSANEFNNNNEVQEIFFNRRGEIKRSAIRRLHQDISFLLYPSRKRSSLLNKAYKIIVEEQSFIYGRVGHVNKLKNVYRQIELKR